MTKIQDDKVGEKVYFDLFVVSISKIDAF